SGPTTPSARCQAFVAAFLGACGTRYTVSENACDTATRSLKISAACNNTFVGISRATSPFDESYLGPLPDGEQEAIGTTAVAVTVPALRWPALLAAALAITGVALARSPRRRKRPRLFV